MGERRSSSRRSRARCPRCYRAGTPVDPRSWRRLRAWLLHGDRRPRLRCDNGHTWVAAAGGGGYRAATARNLPGRLLGVLRRRRTAEPSPAFMLGVVVAGFALGVLVDAALGWPWWLVTVLVPVLVWLAFLATAFSRRVTGGLLADLLGQVGPGGTSDKRRVGGALAAAPSPPLGLAGWDGPRGIGGHSWSGDEIRSVELVHGSPPTPAYVVVTTTWRAEHERLPSRRHLAPRGRHRWRPITLPVDGVARPFTYLPTRDGWVARAQLADVVIELTAAGVEVDAVALVAVTDLAGYH